MANRELPQDEDSDDACEVAVASVRDFARARLNEGVTGADLAYALAYVAAEMGIAVAPSAVQAMACVLAGAEGAVREAAEREAANQGVDSLACDSIGGRAIH